MTDAELLVFAGWKAGSQHARTYLHLAGADIGENRLNGKNPCDTCTSDKAITMLTIFIDSNSI
jgi:hypothetical protein